VVQSGTVALRDPGGMLTVALKRRPVAERYERGSGVSERQQSNEERNRNTRAGVHRQGDRPRRRGPAEASVAKAVGPRLPLSIPHPSDTAAVTRRNRKRAFAGPATQDGLSAIGCGKRDDTGSRL